jgi:hypothetical protein
LTPFIQLLGAAGKLPQYEQHLVNVFEQGPLCCTPVVDALIAHVLAQHPAVCCEAGYGDAHVIINFEHLALVRRQVILCPLQRCQHYMRVALHHSMQAVQ